MKYILACLMLPELLLAQVTWERVISGVLDGRPTPGLYTGGFERNKPTLCDIDADGDLDLLIGGWDGTIVHYKNIGTPTDPEFEWASDSFCDVTVRWGMNRGYSAPCFVDIDADGDLDLFSGDFLGKMHSYTNEGTITAPSLAFVDTLPFERARHSCPASCDIDDDGDYDLWIGEEYGFIWRYENAGDSAAPVWTLAGIDTTGHGQSSPVFFDMDDDGDFDLFAGKVDGSVVYWENTGTADSAVWSDTACTITDVSGFNRSGPAFADIDGDNDLDLFLGARDGLMRFYENTGRADSFEFEFVTDQYNYLDFGYHSCPAFADIDGDGNMDMIVGTQDGNLRLCRNVGTNEWIYETREYIESCIVSGGAAPAFVDIDADGDTDLFIGKADGKITFYRNDSTEWTFITDFYNSIDVGLFLKPTFADIDADRDYDLFIGEKDGKLFHYRNDGNAGMPSWTFITESYVPDTVGGRSAPAFTDVDLDGDLDLFLGVGYAEGTLDSLCGGYIYFYENQGDSLTPVWTLVDTMYNGIDVSRYSTPAFTDIDADGDYDLFVGEADGGINFWRNGLIPGISEREHTVQGARCKMQVSPNPFTHNTVITVGATSRLRLADRNLLLHIYDLTGRLVRSFPFNHLTIQPFSSEGGSASGGNQITWDRKDSHGKKVPKGIYFCKLKADGITMTGKMCVLE